MSGRTLFAQTMDFLPWTTFERIVVRYRGNRHVRTLRCAEQYRAMAFAQLTWRESLRDIETCLEAQAGKLCHSGFRGPLHRSARRLPGAGGSNPSWVPACDRGYSSVTTNRGARP